jgi:hypothetical protein
MSKPAAEALRRAADCIDAMALTEERLDLLELWGDHLVDYVMGSKTDRCRQTKIMLRMLDRG